MWVTESPKVILSKEVHARKAQLPMWVTDSPKVMLAKEVHPRKAQPPMWVTDSGIMSKPTWCDCWKAPLEMFVTLEGIFTSKHPCVWMSCFVVASTSFLVYVAVTRGSAPKNPAVSSVSASSMIELSRTKSTLRTLRSIGSWHFFSRTIAFNSRTVAVITTSRVMTSPCKVFNWTSQDMAAKDNWPSGRGQRNWAVHMNRGWRAAFSAVFLLLHLFQYVKGRLEILCMFQSLNHVIPWAISPWLPLVVKAIDGSILCPAFQNDSSKTSPKTFKDNLLTNWLKMVVGMLRCQLRLFHFLRIRVKKKW